MPENNHQTKLGIRMEGEKKGVEYFEGNSVICRQTAGQRIQKEWG